MVDHTDLPDELAAFLSDSVVPAEFHHVDHVRVAFEILQRHEFAEAACAYVWGLKRIAARAGNPGAYHETITIAFLSLIAERSIGMEYGGFDAFTAANGDLLDKSALSRWYGPEQLASTIARKTFVLPRPA
jgi:hypothetical protein